MKAIMNSEFAWLLKREYWESRKGFLWAPVWTMVVLLSISILGIATLEIFRSRLVNSISAGADGVRVTSGGAGINDLLQNALSHNVPMLVQALDTAMLSFGTLAGIVMTFVVFFYFLGALYDDRRDRSILFWKSLPVSDTATVLSKVVAGAVMAPLITVAVVLAAYLCDQVIHTVWFALHGLNPITLIWAHVEPYSVWLHMLAMVPLYALWALPTIGWLLFCSAAARGKPFLWAVALPIAAGALNSWIALLGVPHIPVEFFWKVVGRALLSLIPAGWVSVMPVDPNAMVDPPSVVRHFGSYSQMAHVFVTPELWIGALAGAGLVAAAIWFRRWRSEV